MFESYKRLAELQNLHECSRCGKCCSDKFIRFLYVEDIERIQAWLSKPENLDKHIDLIYFSANPPFWTFDPIGSCPHYDSDHKLCKIYAIRPDCCRYYPFANLHASASSLESALDCPMSRRALAVFLGTKERSPKVTFEKA